MDLKTNNSLAKDSVYTRAFSTNEKATTEQELKKACADFESIFIYTMLQKMRRTVPKSGLFHPMTGKDVYTTIMDQKVAEDLAGRGGLGLQKVLFENIRRKSNNVAR